MVGLFGVCFFLIGFVHGSILMYTVSFFCFAIILAGAFFAWVSLRNMKCTRSTTGLTVFSGDPLEGKVCVTESISRSRLLEVYDQHTNLISGLTTRRRVSVLIERGARGSVAVVAGTRQAMPKEGTTRVLEVRDVLRFSRRGHYRLGPLVIRAHDPFGLCFLSRLFPQEFNVIVYPRPLPIPEIVIGGGIGRQNTEVRPMGRAGESSDFHSLRPYVQGDDLRRVHWKSTAHTGKLAIKEFEYRYSGAVQVILDLQHGVHSGEREYATLEAAITLTASVLNHVLSNGNQAGLLATGAQLVSLPQESGQRQLHRALEALALARDDGTINIAQALAGGVGQLSRRCTSIVITPTVDPAIIGPMLAVRGRSAQLLLVLIDRASFIEAEQEQEKARKPLLSLARTPFELTGLGNLLNHHKGAPTSEDHQNLVRAATAAGIVVYPITANTPLHLALQGIRKHM